MSILACNDVTKSFRAVTALAGATVSFTPGVTGIIGPNGSGKSTLVDILTGFVRPDTGSCRVDDHITTRLPPHRIARLGVARTFQYVSPITSLTAIENVVISRLSLRVSRLTDLLRAPRAAPRPERAEAVALLQHLGIGHKVDDLPGTLSYGERKLIAIAACLFAPGPILLFDEPFAGLSPSRISVVKEHLQRAGGEHRTVVIIDHNLAAICDVADRVIALEHGKIVWQGPAGDMSEIRFA